MVLVFITCYLFIFMIQIIDKIEQFLFLRRKTSIILEIEKFESKEFYKNNYQDTNYNRFYENKNNVSLIFNVFEDRDQINYSLL